MNLKFSWIIFLMWMLFKLKKKKKKGKRDICMCWISWRINNHLPCRTVKTELSDAFCIFLSTLTCRLLHHVLISAPEWLWDLFWRSICIVCFDVWTWPQTMFISGSSHFAYNMLTSPVLNHLLFLQNDKRLLTFLGFSFTFLYSIVTSDPSAEDSIEWPVV